jgi:hypothetical protein
MNIIARSKQFLYIDNGIKVITVQLNHSEAQIENSFATLPFVNNLDEAVQLFDLKNECELNAFENQSLEC